MTSSAFKLRSAPSAAALLAGALGNGYAFVVAQLSSLMRPQGETSAEVAMRLRVLAVHYAQQQPSFAADLRAAADRADADDMR